MCQIECVYVYHPNLAFRSYANKLSSAVRIFSHIKVSLLNKLININSNIQGAKRLLMIDTLTKFYEYIDHYELKLPSSTRDFHQDGKVGGELVN